MLFLPKYTASEARKKKMSWRSIPAQPDHTWPCESDGSTCALTLFIQADGGVAMLFFVVVKRSSWKKKRAVDTQSRVQAVQCCHKHFFASHLPPSGVSVLPFIPCETSPFQFWQHQYSLDMFLQLYFSLMSAICLPDTAVLFYKLCYQSILREGSLFCAPSEVSPFPWGFFSEGLVFP